MGWPRAGGSQRFFPTLVTLCFYDQWSKAGAVGSISERKDSSSCSWEQDLALPHPTFPGRMKQENTTKASETGRCIYSQGFHVTECRRPS